MKPQNLTEDLGLTEGEGIDFSTLGELREFETEILDKAKADATARDGKIRLFKELLELADYKDQIMVETDEDGGLTLSEPDNAPAFYSSLKVQQLAQACGLESLVTCDQVNIDEN